MVKEGQERIGIVLLPGVDDGLFDEEHEAGFRLDEPLHGGVEVCCEACAARRPSVDNSAGHAGKIDHADLDRRGRSQQPRGEQGAEGAAGETETHDQQDDPYDVHYRQGSSYIMW